MSNIQDHKRVTNIHSHINAKRPGYYQDALSRLKKGAFNNVALHYATSLRLINKWKKY